MHIAGDPSYGGLFTIKKTRGLSPVFLIWNVHRSRCSIARGRKRPAAAIKCGAARGPNNGGHFKAPVHLRSSTGVRRDDFWGRFRAAVANFGENLGIFRLQSGFDRTQSYPRKGLTSSMRFDYCLTKKGDELSLTDGVATGM